MMVLYVLFNCSLGALFIFAFVLLGQDKSLKLNVLYYIKKQLIPPVNTRVCIFLDCINDSYCSGWLIDEW